MVTEYSIAQAVIAHLEQDQAVQSLFGDTWNQAAQTGIAKFFTDISDQVQAPYCVISEIGETYQFNTMSTTGPGGGNIETSFLSPGQMLFKIFAGDRGQARQLGFSIAKSLNDAPLSWPVNKNTMLFRMNKSWFIEIGDPSGPGEPIVFCRAFLFDYTYSATLGDF